MGSNKKNKRQNPPEEREKELPGAPGKQEPKRHEEAPGRNPAPTLPAGDPPSKKEGEEERFPED